MNFRKTSLLWLVMFSLAAPGLFPGIAAAGDDVKKLAMENPCTWPDVVCSAENLENGGTITMTSAEAGQVRKIQEHAAMMAQGKKCANHKKERGHHRGGKMMTGCPSAWPNVATKAENLPNGAKVTWTSDDANQISSIKDYLKMMAEMKHVTAADEEVVCPVTGTKIQKSKASNSLVYKGKTYYFCCPGCDQQFLKNPEKYLRETAKQAK